MALRPILGSGRRVGLELLCRIVRVEGMSLGTIVQFCASAGGWAACWAKKGSLGMIVQFCASAGGWEGCMRSASSSMAASGSAMLAGSSFSNLGGVTDFIDDEDGGAEADGGRGVGVGEDGAEGFKGEIGEFDGAVAVEEGTVVVGDG